MRGTLPATGGSVLVESPATLNALPPETERLALAMDDLSDLARFRQVRHLILKLEGPVDLSPLAALPALESLDVTSATTLDALPAEVYALHSLRELSLQAAGALALDGLPEAYGLERLRLRGSGLEGLPDGFGVLPLLRELHLALEGLTEVPVVVEWDELQTLSLVGLALSRLPDRWIPEGLQRLRCVGVPLVVLPESLRRARDLCELEVKSACLREVPTWIGEFPRLVTLSVEDSGLEVAPRQIAELVALETLSFAGNPIESFSDLGGLQRLRQLDLSRTGLLDVPQMPKGCQVELPDRLLSRPIPAVSSVSLSPRNLAALAALGAVPTSTPAKPKRFRIAGESHRLHESIRQLLSFELPPMRLQRDGIDFAVSWEPGSSLLEEYWVVRHGPWIALATDQFHSMWVVSLDDEALHDPLIHKVDHDDFRESAPRGVAVPLSTWLESLTRA